MVPGRSVGAGIRCAACQVELDFVRDLLARRFKLHESQRALTPGEVLRVTHDPMPPDAGGLPVIDYSRAVHQYLLACPSCLSITRTDRPSRSDDVVPGRVSLAVPAAFVVSAVRRMERAAEAGRVGREARAISTDPVRRYALRVPAVFRAARPAFGENAALVADVTWSFWRPEHAGPQGLVWDDGPAASGGRAALRRLVAGLRPSADEVTRTLPFQYGEVTTMELAGLVIARIGRGTRLPVLGEEGAALRVGPPRVRFDEARAERTYTRLLPPNGFVVPLDLVIPA